MNCERVREQIPELLAGRLEAAVRQRLIDHLDTCAGCRAEVAQLGVVFRGLEAMEEAEPGPAMKGRFLEALRAYQEGYHDAERRLSYLIPKRRWYRQPAWQAAAAAVLLAAGVLGGRYLGPRGQQAAGGSEIAQLRGQVESLRQMVALSLLDQQSASSRLRGVTYSYQIAQPDREVEQALLHAANRDSNVNVRLAAVDALSKFAGDAAIRRALADSLSVQDSPLVQVALIDVMALANAHEAEPALHKLSSDPIANDAVRQRAAAALAKLGGTQ